MKKFLSLLSIFLLAACSMNSQKNDSKEDYAFRIINNNKDLLITTKQTAEASKQEELEIETLPPMVENTFSNIINKQDILDDEETPYDYGKYILPNQSQQLGYFKFTFYVKNKSNTDSSFDINFYLKNLKMHEIVFSTEDTIRLMIFENNEHDSHNYRVFAKSSYESNYDINGNKTTREFISVYPRSSNQEDANHPLAELLELTGDHGLSVKYSQSDFKANAQIRYTMVVWLEGEDPQSVNAAQVPLSTSFQIGAEIANH